MHINYYTLLQNPDCMETYFYVLRVDEDNVQMSDFVKRTLGVTEFENGRAYYQLTQTEEDFVSYKEVLRMHKVIKIYNIIYCVSCEC